MTTLKYPLTNCSSHLSLCQDRLLVTEVTASSCKLAWGAARNTGGLPLQVTQYTLFIVLLEQL